MIDLMNQGTKKELARIRFKPQISPRGFIDWLPELLFNTDAVKANGQRVALADAQKLGRYILLAKLGLVSIWPEPGNQTYVRVTDRKPAINLIGHYRLLMSTLIKLAGKIVSKVEILMSAILLIDLSIGTGAIIRRSITGRFVPAFFWPIWIGCGITLVVMLLAEWCFGVLGKKERHVSWLSLLIYLRRRGLSLVEINNIKKKFKTREN